MQAALLAAEAVARFSLPALKRFVCPTCLGEHQVDDLAAVTEGHIIPRAAKGRQWVPLCERCNKTFGAAQDKWFGEYLRLTGDHGVPKIFRANSQRGFLTIEGERINGIYGEDADGGIGFTVYSDRNSPDALLRYQAAIQAARQRGRLQISFPVPVLENSQLVKVGFLTAAYLMWFQVLGYSWVFQSHLASIRAQILRPNEKVLPDNYVGAVSSIPIARPFLAIGEVAGTPVLATGIADRVVLLPAICQPGLYSNLPEDLSGTKLSSVSLFRPRNLGLGSGPFGVLVGDRLIVCPDSVRGGQVEAPFLSFPETGGPARVLRPVSESEFDAIRARPGTKHLSLRL